MANNFDAIRNLNQIIGNREVKQRQEQEQEQEQDQNVRSILRNIGNNTVTVDIDNDSIAVAILASFGCMAGVVEPALLMSCIDRIQTSKFKA